MAYESPDFGDNPNAQADFAAGWVVSVAIAIVTGLAYLAYLRY